MLGPEGEGRLRTLLWRTGEEIGGTEGRISLPDKTLLLWRLYSLIFLNLRWATLSQTSLLPKIMSSPVQWPSSSPLLYIMTDLDQLPMPTCCSMLLWIWIKVTKFNIGKVTGDKSYALLVWNCKYSKLYAAAFSVFPPFYYGIVSVSLGWATLVTVLLMHIMCFVKKCDSERSGWSYCYLLFHIMIGTWMVVSLLLGYYWSSQQPLAADTNGWSTTAHLFVTVTIWIHTNIKNHSAAISSSRVILKSRRGSTILTTKWPNYITSSGQLSISFRIRFWIILWRSWIFLRSLPDAPIIPVFYPLFIVENSSGLVIMTHLVEHQIGTRVMSS